MAGLVYGILKILHRARARARTDPTKLCETSIFLIELRRAARHRSLLSMEIDRAACVTAGRARARFQRKRRRKIKRWLEGKWKLI